MIEIVKEIVAWAVVTVVISSVAVMLGWVFFGCLETDIKNEFVGALFGFLLIIIIVAIAYGVASAFVWAMTFIGLI